MQHYRSPVNIMLQNCVLSLELDNPKLYTCKWLMVGLYGYYIWQLFVNTIKRPKIKRPKSKDRKSNDRKSKWPKIIRPKSKGRNQKTENQLTEIIKFSDNTFKKNFVIAPACSLCDSTSYVRFRSSYRLIVTN